MVDRADLGRVNGLVAEYNQITRALANFDQGGRIIAMTIGPDNVTVSTDDIQYPPQMVEAIKQALTQRRSGIEQQLNELGMTGEEPPPWPPGGQNGEPIEPTVTPAAAPVGAQPRQAPPPAGGGRLSSRPVRR